MNDTMELDRPLELALFTRQFATLLDAGLALIKELEILERDGPPSFRAAAGRLRERVNVGHTLSSSMREMPDLFSPFYCRMVRAGEVGGMLEVSLFYLADLMEEEWKLWRQSGRQPGLSQLFDPAATPLPDEWNELDRQQQLFTLTLFCRSFGMLLAAGVPRDIALETAAEMLPLRQRESVKNVIGTLTKADRLSDRLVEAGFLPHMAVQLLAIGEESGQADRMMEKAADLYRHELLCRFIEEGQPARASGK